MHFCANVWCLCLNLLFYVLLGGVVLFPLCNCCSCFLLNWQNSAAFSFHIVFLHFPSYFHIYCAQLFICLLACFFGFWYCMCNYLLALFFAVLLCIASFTFVATMLTFAYCWCVQVVGGATSSFWAVCAHFGFVFFVTHTLIDMHLVPFTLIYCVVEFLLFVLARFLLTFFSM